MSIKVFYNEIDPFCCAWLSNLMDAGLIRPGTISNKSIVDLTLGEVKPYDLAHFFAGIAGWDLALTLAGWRFDGRVTWTGSCPCQPFSAAGKGDGFTDERHLWPAWDWLIGECKPGVIFGEQVESAISHGWLDLVQTDLEAKGYAVGAVGLPACSVGAPHIRQRLWFVADLLQERRRRWPEDTRQKMWPNTGIEIHRSVGELGNTDNAGPQGLRGSVEQHDKDGRKITQRHEWPAGFWNPADWLLCRDGKARPVEPGTFPLAHGVSARVGRLRGYGDAIAPQVAAEVIEAYLDAEVCG